MYLLPTNDQALTRMIRRLISNFIQSNPDFKNGQIDLAASVVAEGLSLDEYQRNVVLKEGEEVRKPLIGLAAIVLGISIEVIEFDLRESVNSWGNSVERAGEGDL